jgi:lysophospholipase L1-like esterase
VKIPSGVRLVFAGDSITDCGRARPAVEGRHEALGEGYVSLVDALLAATCPGHRIRMINVGVCGDTVRDLAARWQRDVVAWSPDWLSVMIGINDVWRKFGSPEDLPEHVPLVEYTSTLDGLLRRTRPKLQGLVLMTPYHIQPDRSDPMRAMMDEYGAVVRGLAAAYHAVLVDTQAAFDQVLESVDAAELAEDHVHPGLVGHAILARAFLQAVEFRW